MNRYIWFVFVHFVDRNLENTPLFPDLWKFSPSSECSLRLHPVHYCGQTAKWLLIFQKIERTHTKKWGREKSDKKRMGRNMIWGGYVHGFSINIFVRLHPTIHNNTANLMWFVEKIKRETIRQKKERNISNKSNTTTERRKENDSAIRFYDSVLFFASAHKRVRPIVTRYILLQP